MIEVFLKFDPSDGHTFTPGVWSVLQQFQRYECVLGLLTSLHCLSTDRNTKVVNTGCLKELHPNLEL